MESEYIAPPFDFLDWLVDLMGFLLGIFTGIGQGLGLLNFVTGFF